MPRSASYEQIEISRRLSVWQRRSCFGGLTMKRIVVLGGDGFCGWPSALGLSAQGHEVTIIDNLSRRRIDAELGAGSLTPITDITGRLAAWKRVTGRTIAFRAIDVAKDAHALGEAFREIVPDTVIHFAEQRAAPYS